MRITVSCVIRELCEEIMKALITDIKRMLVSPRLLAAIIIGLALFLHPLLLSSESWKSYSPMQLLALPLGISDFTPFAAVFCVLPFADSFCEDYKSGYYNQISLRTGVKKYALSRCATVAVSGAIPMGIFMLVAIVLSRLVAGQIDTVEATAFLGSTIWAKANIILPYSGLILYAFRILLAVLFGALWALVGLLISTLVMNRYITLIMPFVIYQALWYFLDGTIINPVYLIRADHAAIPSLGFVIIYQTIWLAVLATLSVLGIRKRVEI